MLAVTSYFLTLGRVTPCMLWTHSAGQESEGQAEYLFEQYIYLKFMENVMQVFHDAVLLVEDKEVTICELYNIMSTVITKLQQCIDNSFFWIRRWSSPSEPQSATSHNGETRLP